MPEKQEASGLLAALGTQLVSAFNEGKAKPVDLNFGGQMPAGIENGIAELRDLKIGKYADGTPLAGKPYFLGQAIALTPVEHKGQKVAGLFTRIGPEPLCDTLDRTGEKSRKTFQEHFQWMLDHLRQLGWNPAEIVGKTPQEVENILLTAMKALCQRKPPIYFRFRTWKGAKQVIARDTDGKIYLFNEDDDGNRKRITGKGPYPSEQVAKVRNPYAGKDPMVQHVWGEVVADFKPSANGNGVEDGTDQYTPTNRISGMTNGAATEHEASTGNGEGNGSFDEFGDLDNLVQRAMHDDGAAQDQLTEQAQQAGYSEDEVSAAADWNAVAEMIRNPKSAESGEPDGGNGTEPNGEKTPEVKEVVNYHPVDPKTKKPARKAVECEIVAVDKGAKTVNLKSLRDGKTLYNSVPWDQLA